MTSLADKVLILGGAKSGKSSLAQRLAEHWGGRLVYLATAQAGDAEMHERIARHQAQRGAAWTTLEEPLALEEALKQADGPDAVLLVDCLTLWLSNLVLGANLGDEQVAARGEALATLLPSLEARVILVANEVGLGIVPENALARRWRDLAGGLNQRLASACGSVVLVTAGLPLALKGRLPNL
ncbi:MAG: bifunctional adenosylcobinamide kinase/adenosylcobinamide-phosphate guanylyltransferase [Desulfarculaceae bacterium]|nr:bifunctional adenosylcobinamide kinase/adenosylcobinamide-phosphate guanylyltransferase [Desulfarculaceae bacterium]MCF8074415.1 bifunctional adenosylcobinamide kinase/adenosylcobinamide-phosphate guanylyltransferase [Desulfarculaceae bacterium]MCF8103609.1 bifunctional adenosylcobinamide kinase/adenosylcobinamide-phosphate guanylyltransferase [Desulfarculaceae bacterium]MCF8116022.1 bifunctional adenosylcobinamide kinase/adenosylcobinamide-phosphate guanylyltransferase [Desulfarculaceae bact